MEKALMGMVVGAMLILVGLTSSTVLSDEAFTITTASENYDEYPGNESWNFYGTLNGTLEEDNGDLVASGTNGTYTSDEFYEDGNTTIEVDQLVYETSDIRDGDEVNLFVEYLNDDGVTVGSQNISITEEVDSYAFESIDTEYSGYRFILTTSDAGTGQDLRIESLTFTIDVFETLTDDLPFNFSEFLLIIPLLLGIIIEVISFTVAILRIGE